MNINVKFKLKNASCAARRHTDRKERKAERTMDIQKDESISEHNLKDFIH